MSRSLGFGVGVGLTPTPFLPTHIPGCQLWCETDTSAHPTAVVFPADPCVNGTFAADSDWTKGADWTIDAGAGVAKHAAVGANDLSQACLVIGNTYTITYTVTAQTAGNITVKAGTTAGTARTAPGTYTETLLCAGSTSLIFTGDAACDAWIDNVLVSPRNASQLTDLTGLGHHLLQATASKQPLWVASGVGGLLRFDGTDVLKASAFTLNQPEHVFVMAKYPATVGETYLFDGDAGGSMTYDTAGGAGATLIFAGAVLNGPGLSGNDGIYEGVFNGANSGIALNGAALTVGNAGAANGGGFTLCAYGDAVNGKVNGDVYAVVVYDSALSEANRQRVVRYLRRLGARLGVSIP